MIDRALMDYEVVSRAVVSRLLDVNVFRGEAGGMSDHYLVEAKLRMVAYGQRRNRCIGTSEKVKVSELRKREKQERFQELM